MIKKRILATILMLTLAFSVARCGKSKKENSTPTETTTNEENNNSSNSKKESISFEEKKDEILELGEKQQKAIKEILDKYEVHTSYDSDNEDFPIIVFTKDKNDIGITGYQGYNVKTQKNIKLKDGGDNSYNIRYIAEVEDRTHTIFYDFNVIMIYPNDQEFKLDNFKMLKELMKAVYGDSYDLNSLESFIQKQIKEANEKNDFLANSEREVGIYKESLGNGKNNDNGQTTLTFEIELKDRY